MRRSLPGYNNGVNSEMQKEECEMQNGSGRIQESGEWRISSSAIDIGQPRGFEPIPFALVGEDLRNFNGGDNYLASTNLVDDIVFASR